MSYLSRIFKSAWHDTWRDVGFCDGRSAAVKFFWIAIAFSVAIVLGGAAALTDQFGKAVAAILTSIFVFIVLFLLNFVLAPSKLQRAADNEIVDLKMRLNNKETRQRAMARLWTLRTEGTVMRNEIVTANDATAWKQKYDDWRARVLSEATKISLNLRAWLETLDRVRPGPADLPPAATPEHYNFRSFQSEILLRMEEFLQAEMLHRDIVAE